MLTLLILIPLIGVFLILPISNSTSTSLNTIETTKLINDKSESEKEKKLKLMRQIALTTSLINFFVSLFLWYLLLKMINVLLNNIIDNGNPESLYRSSCQQNYKNNVILVIYMIVY